MIGLRSLIVSFATAGLLAGCADCSRDPSQVGLGCATGNLVTGVYTEDDAKIQREIDALDARRGLLESEAERYRQQAAQLRGQRQAYARKVSALARETAQVNAQVADLNRRQGVDRQRLAELRQQERDLSGRVLDLSEGGAENEAEIKRLNDRIGRLKTQIRNLAGT